MNKAINITIVLFAAMILFVSLVPPSHAGGTNYVLMAVQPTTVDDVEVYTLVNGASTFDVPVSRSIKLAESGPWHMVQFLLGSIKPTAWSTLQAAQWLSAAEGFLAFDYAMVTEYARAGVGIQGRTFDYDAVLDVLLTYEWWTFEEVDGEIVYTRATGSKADYIANGYPSKLVRIVPMPVYLGVN